MEKRAKAIRGTREWAVAEIDCCTGCPHDCRYCYARYDAVERQGLGAGEGWRTPRLDQAEVETDRPLYQGQVMFPTAHDIVPEILDSCVTVIANLLAAGNRVLVVTKPHLECVVRLCREFAGEKGRLLFRFTITARDEALLKFWEPGAPGFAERRQSLCHAWEQGFETSVSVEPILDMADVAAMVRQLRDCVTHSIWLGKMNKIDRRVRAETVEERRQVERIIANQDDARIRELYEQLRGDPLIRWKESIKEVIGLQLQDQPGMDV